MRILASLWLIGCFCAAAQAADITLAPLPQPDDRAVESHIFGAPAARLPLPVAAAAPGQSADLMMPALPPAVAEVPQIGPGAYAATAPLAPQSEQAAGLAFPTLPPQPADAGEAILASREPERAQATASVSPRPVDESRAEPDQPPLPDPNAVIAMMPPRRPAVEPPVAVPPVSLPQVMPPAVPLPAPPSSALPPVSGLDGEALDRAFATLGRLQGLPPAVVRAAREAYERAAATPIWTGPGLPAGRVAAMFQAVDRAGQHGLSPARYGKLRAALIEARDNESREAAATLLAVAYARDARGARVQPQQVSRLITATTTLPEAEEVLGRLMAASDAGAALEAFNPSHPGYLALKRKLAELAAPVAPATETPHLTFGPVLTRGMTDARVPILRALLGLPPGDDAIYDAALVEAVRAFQRERHMRATGRLTRSTVAALGGVPETVATARDPRADIIANMERWRWLPADLGADHVFVNVPDFQLTLMRSNTPVLKTRVIVGKPDTQTPIFSHRMQFLVVNPSWNVPPSIALKEYLPLLQRNPQALAARGLQVVSRGRVVDPATVDWSHVGRTVAIRQPPGERNALGHIKFMFPNQHAVYLHDTPNRSLFVNERRAYSHGCVRVQDPFRLAEAIMGGEWSERRLRSMVGGGERQINLPDELPVHLAYFTTFVDEAGALQSREDLYGHNRKVKALLGL